MLLHLPMYASDGDPFRPDAYASTVGRRLTVKDGDRRVTGVLRAVQVDEDRESLRLVLEVPDATPGVQKRLPGRPPRLPAVRPSEVTGGMSMGG